MIYDTFIFFNELDLLEIRLNILDGVVDRFVLVEATRTFQGNPKPLLFETNKHRFAKFNDRIIHVIVDDIPIDAAPFDREHFQRNAILRGLKACEEDDLVLISDLDEIPNPEAIPASLEKGQIGFFVQKLFYYTLNTKCLELDSLPWSLIVRFNDIGLPADLRKLLVAYQATVLAKSELGSTFRIIEDGGWHFSYLGGPEIIAAKLEAFSHSELNLEKFKDLHHIRSAMSDGSDIFGRNLTFARAALEELPKFVRENFQEFRAKGLLHC